MEKKEILTYIDHTILKPEATWEDVKVICDEAIWGEAASVCISPVYVKEASRYLLGKIPVCTVIGFPHGTSKPSIKALEAAEAVFDGAAEVDMVIHVGKVKAGLWDELLDEITKVKRAVGDACLKVIIETCLLTEEEKIKLCQIVSDSGAEFIKTSTGFSTGGATLEDILLFGKHLAPHVKIKAAGGIRTFEATKAFLDAGADRIGSSALIPLMQKEEN